MREITKHVYSNLHNNANLTINNVRVVNSAVRVSYTKFPNRMRLFMTSERLILSNINSRVEYNAECKLQATRIIQ